MTLDRNGIMFSAPFPTLGTLDDTRYSGGYWSLLPTGAGTPEELTDWLVVSVDPRGWLYSDDDAEALDETNFEALCDAVGADIPCIRSDYRFLSSGNEWVVSGIAEALEAGVAHFGRLLIVSPDNTDALDAAESCDRALADYPLLDEEAYSQREWEAWVEYAPQAFGDEIRCAVRDGLMSDEVAEQLEDAADELLPALSQHLHYSYGFSGDYGPEFLSILGDALNGLLV